MIKSNEIHEIVYQELTDLLRRHSGEVSPLEVLAIAANMVGKLIALQDQRVTSPATAMDVVCKNMELGNLQAISSLAGPAAGAA